MTKFVYSLPFNHTISAHYLSSESNVKDDLSWELCTDPAHPLGISIESSLGLRARVLQIIPVILDAKSLPVRLNETGLQIEDVFADQFKLTLSDPNLLDVSCLVWVPSGNTITGEFVFHYHKRLNRELRAGIMVRAITLEGGSQVRAHPRKVNPYLSMEFENIFLACSINGTPELIHKPHSGLVTPLDHSTSHDTHVRWGLSAAEDAQSALSDCTKWLQTDWQAKVKRSAYKQTIGKLSVATGMDDLDECLQLAQIQTERLRIPVSEHMPFSTLVTSRQPEDRNPIAETGVSDKRSLTIWELYHYISHIMTAGQVGSAWGMARNFIMLQRGDGHIDLQPDFTGGWTHLLAAPLLAGCYQRLDRVSPNSSAVREAYPILKKYVYHWLDHEHDPDQDRLPIWQNILQTGWAENPLFVVPYGNPVWSVESPALGALLYRELDALASFAKTLGYSQDEKDFLQMAAEVKSAVMQCYDHRGKCFHYRDADSHEIYKGNRLSRGSGPGSFTIERELEKPVRLRTTLEMKKMVSGGVEVQIQGYRADGEHVIERIPIHAISWLDSSGSVTSRQLFKRVTTLSISGIGEKDSWELVVPDVSQSDLSLFLPLWAGIPEQQIARQIIENCLLPNWEAGYPNGLGMLPSGSSSAKEKSISHQVNPIILCMVLEGLFHYGYRAEASRLVMGMMKAIINHVKMTGCFSEAWDGLTNNPIGKHNHLTGLAPISLFLQMIGVEVIDDHRAAIFAENYLDRPVRLQYQDLRITRGIRDGQISFRNEPPVNIFGVESRLIDWKKISGGA